MPVNSGHSEHVLRRLLDRVELARIAAKLSNSPDAPRAWICSSEAAAVDWALRTIVKLREREADRDAVIRGLLDKLYQDLTKPTPNNQPTNES